MRVKGAAAAFASGPAFSVVPSLLVAFRDQGPRKAHTGRLAAFRGIKLGILVLHKNLDCFIILWLV